MNEFDLRKFLYENSLLEKKEDSKKGNKKEQKRMEGAIKDDADHIEKLQKDLKADKKKLAKLKKDEPKDVNESKEVEEGMDKEDKKLTKEGLKNMIKEKITSILNEDSIEEADEDVDVEKDINIDVEDEVDIDDESVESDIEVKTSIPGESKDVDAVLGLLTKAKEEAESLGDEKLMDQIGNTITFFTRKHIAS